jgi:rubrerythrin
MENNLTVTEILEMALEKEKDAVKFYKTAVTSVKDPKAKMLFELFAIEEQKHVARLEFELIKTGKTISQDEDLLSFEDLDFIVEVTPEMKPVYLDILIGAINKEDEALKLFLNMLPLTDSIETRDILAALIEEEVRHKILLEIKYNRAYAQ